MRYLAIILLSSLTCFGQVVISGNNVISGNVSIGGTPAAGISQFFFESFNPHGTGTDAASFDNATANQTGTINADYVTAPAPIEGAESLIVNAGSSCLWTFGANHGEVDAVFLYSPSVNAPTGANNPIFRLDDSGASDKMLVYHKTDGTLQYNPVGGTSANPSTTLVAGTKYIIWLHQNPTTGVGSIAFAIYNGSQTRPTSGTTFYAQSTGGTDYSSLNPIVRLYLNSDTGTAENNIFDYVKLSDGPGLYGNNP